MLTMIPTDCVSQISKFQQEEKLLLSVCQYRCALLVPWSSVETGICLSGPEVTVSVSLEKVKVDASNI
jgi:hypothetical protein